PGERSSHLSSGHITEDGEHALQRPRLRWSKTYLHDASVTLGQRLRALVLLRKIRASGDARNRQRDRTGIRNGDVLRVAGGIDLLACEGERRRIQDGCGDPDVCRRPWGLPDASAIGSRAQ